MYNVMIFDPGESTGYCIIEINNNSATILQYGFFDIDKSSDYIGDHCINLMTQVEDKLREYKVVKCGIEDYFFSKRTANGSNCNAAYRTAIHILCRMLDIEYFVINISSWKIYVAGRRNPTKVQKKEWGKSANKIFIQDALWSKWGIRFPNYCISNKTGKCIHPRYDIVDVVAQGIYYCGIVLNINNIRCAVVPPEDISWDRKNKPKILYTYI
jgi:Holliday junction resolvasome RuvABC endonuclease subunit